MNNFEFIVLPAYACICKQNTNSRSLDFNMQPEFTALHGEIRGFLNSKQEFEQIRIFKINKYIIKMA